MIALLYFGRIFCVTMVISILMMCFGSLLIACLPTYNSIGVWAPVLLLFARLLQGLSVGGEYGTAATYMSEVADHEHRGDQRHRRAPGGVGIRAVVSRRPRRAARRQLEQRVEAEAGSDQRRHQGLDRVRAGRGAVVEPATAPPLAVGSHHS